jgi:hypothetical protein
LPAITEVKADGIQTVYGDGRRNPVTEKPVISARLTCGEYFMPNKVEAFLENGGKVDVYDNSSNVLTKDFSLLIDNMTKLNRDQIYTLTISFTDTSGRSASFTAQLMVRPKKPTVVSQPTEPVLPGAKMILGISDLEPGRYTVDIYPITSPSYIRSYEINIINPNKPYQFSIDPHARNYPNGLYHWEIRGTDLQGTFFVGQIGSNL